MGMERRKKGTEGKEDGRDTQEKGATERAMEGGTGDDGGGGGRPPCLPLPPAFFPPPPPFPLYPSAPSLRSRVPLTKKYFFKFWFDSVARASFCTSPLRAVSLAFLQEKYFF